MKNMFRSVVLSTIAAIALVAATGYSADTNVSTNMPPRMMRGGALRATVEAVNPLTKTVTIKNKSYEGRVLTEDSSSILTMDDKPITLTDVKVGYYVSVTTHMDGTNYVINKAKFSTARPVKSSTTSTNMPTP